MKTQTLNEEGSQFDTAGHEAQVEIYGCREREDRPPTRAVARKRVATDLTCILFDLLMAETRREHTNSTQKGKLTHDLRAVRQ